MKYKLIITIALIGLYIALPHLAHSQPPPDPGGDPDTGVPLDGGLSILLAAGIGYAGKKIRDTRSAYKK